MVYIIMNNKFLPDFHSFFYGSLKLRIGIIVSYAKKLKSLKSVPNYRNEINFSVPSLGLSEVADNMMN